MSNRSPPLSIVARVFDVKSDKEEACKHYNLRKVDVRLNGFRSLKDIKEEELRQQNALDKKWKSIQDLIIWGLNNNKSIEFTNALDDGE